MTEHSSSEARATQKGGVRVFMRTVWVSVEYLSVRVLEAIVEDLRIMREEIDLFLGAAFVLLGVMNWSTGKYCDGNSSDYLSCTRPTVYYYYGAFEIVLVVFGIALVLLWIVKRQHSK